FLFAIANAVAASVLAIAGACIALRIQPHSSSRWLEASVSFVILALAYLVIYLGLASALLWGLRRSMKVGLLAAIVVQVIALCVGMGLPPVIENFFPYR